MITRVAFNIVGAIVLGPLVRAYCFSKAWLWLVVPILHLPAITIGQVFALFVIFTILKPIGHSKEEDEEDTKTTMKRMTKIVFFNLTIPWFFLLEAWVVKSIIF